MGRPDSQGRAIPPVSAAMPTALLSVHDVMPRTLPAVEDTLELIESLGLVRPTLLIVPGLGWTSEQLEQLRAWAAASG